MILVSHCCCLCSIYLKEVLSWEWRCSCSSADRRCSNYIKVINNLIAYYDASYIRNFMVHWCNNSMIFNELQWGMNRDKSTMIHRKWCQFVVICGSATRVLNISKTFTAPSKTLVISVTSNNIQITTNHNVLDDFYHKSQFTAKIKTVWVT